MRIILLIIFWILCFSCSTRIQKNTAVKKSDEISGIIDESPTEKESIINSTVYSLNNDTSSYDKNDHLDRLKKHKDKLQTYSKKNIFSIIHKKLILELSQNHQDFFAANLYFELLSYSYGNLFREKGKDAAFIIYDKKENRIIILVFDEMSNEYFRLYKDLMVENGLEDCYYGSYNTLDYQIGDELIWQEEYLIKQGESYLQYSPCRITDISNDPNIILSRGCFANDFSKTNTFMSLCIPNSSVYNNWECLKFDKSRNLFIIYYGQAFAD